MPFPVLTQALLAPAEHSLMHLLRHAPATKEKLRAFHGRMLTLDIRSVARINVRLLDSGPELSLGSEADTDACLSGSLNEFLTLARAQDKVSSLMKSQIDISGDTDFALAVTRVLQNSDADWESFISPLTGGLLAHQLGRGFRSFLRWNQGTTETLKQASRDYLQDETGLLVSPVLMQDFSMQVDQLRLAADRVEARIARLESLQTTQDASQSPYGGNDQ